MFDRQLGEALSVRRPRGCQSEQAAHMIDDDLRIGKGAHEIEQFVELILQLPRIVGQAERARGAGSLRGRSLSRIRWGTPLNWGPRTRVRIVHHVLGADAAVAAAAGLRCASSTPPSPHPRGADRRCRRSLRTPRCRSNAPLAAIAAMPLANSTSPEGRISFGPVRRYIEPTSTYTVARTLWPESRSARNSSSKIAGMAAKCRQERLRGEVLLPIEHVETAAEKNHSDDADR